MKIYQKKYLENLRKTARISEYGNDRYKDFDDFLTDRSRRQDLLLQYSRENTGLLRDNLMPLLDDILSASEEDIRELTEFSGALMGDHKDTVLQYYISYAVVTYARKYGKRDLLIRELYQTGMSLYYLESMMSRVNLSRYCWKMRMMFGEAASFIRIYDEIEDTETRGYIHRAMGNLALTYSVLNQDGLQKKMAAIRNSLEILNDPVYQEKTPSLPWDIYIYKSHQERTAALGGLRENCGNLQFVREVMESAQYIHASQLEASRMRGEPMQPQWQYAYEAAQYHCGIFSLSDLLHALEGIYTGISPKDFSQQGMFANVFLPGVYASYMAKEPDFLQSKKSVLTYMYSRLIQYMKSAPNDRNQERLFFYLLSTVMTFVEYPGGIQLKDLAMELIAARGPLTYIHSGMTARLAKLMAEEAVEKIPETLVGIAGTGNIEEVRLKKEDICSLAYNSGFLHDVGVLNFLSLVTLTGRQWMEEERLLFQFHTSAGKKILAQSQSTKLYAAVAEGHHKWYDGTGGYPDLYVRPEGPEAILTDLVSIADKLDGMTDDKALHLRKAVSLDDAVEKICREAGTRYAPHFAALLGPLRPRLQKILEEGRREAYAEIYRMTADQD